MVGYAKSKITTVGWRKKVGSKQKPKRSGFQLMGLSTGSWRIFSGGVKGLNSGGREIMVVEKWGVEGTSCCVKK